MGDRVAHFNVSGKAPLRTMLPNYTPTVDRDFYRWGLDCRMVELPNFADFILPRADHMTTAVTDSLNYHLNTRKGNTGLHDLHSSLTTDGPDHVGAIAMGNDADTFTDTRKVALSLTSPLQKITMHMMPDPINPRLLRTYRVPQPTLEEDEVLSPEPIPHIAPTSRPA
jgi:hypothetical protein